MHSQRRRRKEPPREKSGGANAAPDNARDAYSRVHARMMHTHVPRTPAGVDKLIPALYRVAVKYALTSAPVCRSIFVARRGAPDKFRAAAVPPHSHNRASRPDYSAKIAGL